MRTLAITGMVTVCMISRMILIEAIRATPPSLRMSDGTRSRAMTAHAPAFSAILACSALVTSMMTPPLSISARPTFTRHSFALPSAPPLPFTFFASMSVLLSVEMSRYIFNRQSPMYRLPLTAACFAPGLFFLADHHKSSRAFGQHFAGAIANFSNEEQVASFYFRLVALNDDLFVHFYGLQVLHRQFRSYRANLAEPADFAHGLVQERGNNPAVSHSAAALVRLAQNKSSYDPAVDVILHKRQLHAKIVSSAAAKARVRWVGRQGNRVHQIRPAFPFFLLARFHSSMPYWEWAIASDKRNAAALGTPHAALALAHLHAQNICQRCHA